MTLWFHSTVTTRTRESVVAAIAERLCSDDPGHPLRVAVDGVTASGKSTLAAEIATAVRRHGRPTIHLTMDGFHYPRAHRYRQGRLSADGYYTDAYDFDALIGHVLTPLGAGGSGVFRTGIIDLSTDSPTDVPLVHAPRNAVLVVDGTFLLRAPQVEYWDHTIFVDTDFDRARSRGIARDAVQFGGPEKVAEAFDLRYHAASRTYIDEVSPRTLASTVVDNNDVDNPRLIER